VLRGRAFPRPSAVCVRRRPASVPPVRALIHSASVGGMPPEHELQLIERSSARVAHTFSSDRSGARILRGAGRTTSHSFEMGMLQLRD